MKKITILAVATLLLATLQTFAQAASQNKFALDRVLVVTEAGVINAGLSPNLGIAYSKIELLNPTKTIANAKDIFLIYLEKSGEAEVKKAIEILSKNPLIIAAEPDYYHSENAAVPRIPNDPRYIQQWWLPAINAPQAWAISTGSKNVVVGIMDAELDYSHEDLQDNLWINPNPNQTIGSTTYVNDIHGWDFSRNTGTPPPSTSTGHGTHVAGIVGARGNNGVGISGVCWEVSLANLTINANNSRAVRALEYANFHNIPIVQNSWGGYGSPNRALYEAIRNYNGLFVISAGNSAGDLDAVGNSGMHYPAGYWLDLHGFGPGLTNIITVTSSTSSDGGSGNYGATRVHIAAPGSGILSTYPIARNPALGGYSMQSGTSMAAPVISGVAALMMAARADLTDLPNLNPEQIIKIIVSTARKVPAFTDRCIAGGIVDAYAAVMKALTYCTRCDDEGCLECPELPELPPSICQICGDPGCTDMHVAGLLLNRPAANIAVGNTEQLTETFIPSNATNKSVTWSSSNTDVATVDETGLITAISVGTATITVTTEDGGFQRTCIVTVNTSSAATVTAENIETYEPDPAIESVTAFINERNGLYNITEMSPRLDAWRTAYKVAFPQFDRFVFAMPFGEPYTSTAGSLALRIHYTTTGNVWPFSTVAGSPTLIPMTSEGHNPNSDATFQPLVRRDRTTRGDLGIDAPHSTTPPNFGQTAGSPAHHAILGLFTPGGVGSPAHHNAAIDNNNFIGFLNAPTGFTVIQDGTNFWFRSKFDPADWFLAEQQAEVLASVTGVTVNSVSETMEIGQTVQLTATVAPANAANKNVTWSSNNTHVATVSETGLITAVSGGIATITATTADGSFKAQCVVTVNAPIVAVTSVTLNKTAVSLSVGKTEELIETILPSNATNQVVMWSSNNTDVATIDDNGLVTAVSEGTAIITVTTEDGGFTSTCTIAVSLIEIPINEQILLDSISALHVHIATLHDSVGKLHLHHTTCNSENNMLNDSVFALNSKYAMLLNNLSALQNDTTKLHDSISKLHQIIIEWIELTDDLLDTITWLRQALATCESNGTSNAQFISTEQIQIYPNPVNYELTITNYEFQQGDVVELFDMTGKRVFSERITSQFLIPNSQFVIDMTPFPQGNYILRIGNQVAKVVKQ